jgi:hypothetical protein
MVHGVNGHGGRRVQAQRNGYREHVSAVYSEGTNDFNFPYTLPFKGTPVSPGRVRYVHNFVWSSANAPGMTTWNAGFCIGMYSGWLERFASSLETELQLVSLGFPPRASSYWQEANIEAVRMRYGADALKPLLG